MRLAHIAAAAALSSGCNPQWSGRTQVTAIGEILTQGRLNYRRKGWTGIVSRDVSFDRLFEIVGQSDGCSLHRDETSTKWC
jgi:hypothetical protein